MEGVVLIRYVAQTSRPTRGVDVGSFFRSTHAVLPITLAHPLRRTGSVLLANLRINGRDIGGGSGLPRGPLKVPAVCELSSEPCCFADPQHMALTSGSSGGYTVLRTLCSYPDAFAVETRHLQAHRVYAESRGPIYVQKARGRRLSSRTRSKRHSYIC